MMIRCIVVDDEPLARARLRALLEEADADVSVLAEAAGGAEALRLVAELQPDLLFLDVAMPVMNGFDVIDRLPAPRPHIVMVTAHDDHALRAFEANAIDYLTKPVRLARLNATLARLGDRDAMRRAGRETGAPRDQRAIGTLPRITVHAGRRLRVIPIDDIKWIEAREKLVHVHTAAGVFIADFTLDELEARLDATRFLRTHRAHIVNAAIVRELIPWFAGSCALKLDDGTQIPVARRRVREIRELLGG
ncbi:MAG: alginate biosynthesis regulatory protein [Chlorobi bacterium]|nr:alginate biosynthesis regulatory protein [Chlorobiota bacterium]